VSLERAIYLLVLLLILIVIIIVIFRVLDNETADGVIVEAKTFMGRL